MPLRDQTRFPVLGLGVGLWPRQVDELVADGPLPCDYVEVYDDDVITLARMRSALPDDVPVVLHGAALSPAGVDGVPPDLLRSTAKVADVLGTPWVLEDVATWRLDGHRPIGSPFWPPVFDGDTLELLARRVAPLSRVLGRPFVCEVAPLDVFVGSMPLVEFYRCLVDRTGAPLVLDVSHLLRYAQLVGADPIALLDDFPLENVIELHISGGTRTEGEQWYEEEHSAALLPECIGLLDAALGRVPHSRAVTVESHGAPLDVVREAVRAVADLNTVQRLRVQVRADPPDHQPFPRPREDDEAMLASDGPSRLRARQRAVRTALEQPGLGAACPELEGMLDGSILAQFDRASCRRLRRVVEPPRLTGFALDHVGDAGSIVVRFVRASDPPWTVTGLLDFIVGVDELPPWVRDVASFDRDVLRVVDGLAPHGRCQAIEGGWVVEYDRSVVATVNAVAAGLPVPEAEPACVRMVVVGNELVVEEA